jgi:ribosomal protein L7/L12
MAKRIADNELERVRAAMSAGRKIEAIKLYRQASGAGLADAKRFVEALAAGREEADATVTEMSDDQIARIETAIFAGEKIKAIKIYREANGTGLRESKEFIDALEAELRQIEPERFTVPQAKGCGVAVICLLGLLAIVISAVV